MAGKVKYPQNVISYRGLKYRLTLIKTNSLENFSPITQVYGICFDG